jgi:protein TonB
MSQVKVTWQSALLGHLERHKRYPRKARRRNQQGVVTVRVRMNRDGSVASYQLESPSAYQALHKETLALIKRAQPLPPPPAQMKGESIEFVVPIVFSLKR